MAVEVVVPEVGEHGMEVTFVRWRKEAGDEVRAGEPLFELDTDKTTIEVEAFADGTLADLRVAPGDAVVSRQVVAVLLAQGEVLADGVAEHDEIVEPTPQAESQTDDRIEPTDSPTRQPRATPKARRLAALHGVDLAAMSGIEGLIGAQDVENEISRATSSEGEPSRSISGRPNARAAIASRTTLAWQTIPHFHLRLSADLTEVLDVGRPLLLICQALTRSLLDHPECNLEWQEDQVAPREGVDIGVLVAGNAGLVIARIPEAHRRSLAELELALGEAVERGRTGKLTSVDLGARSISVSNLGMFAVDSFTPVLTAPDVLTLSVGRSRVEPRLDDDAAWSARTVIDLTLTVDHRALDGVDGGRLLSTIEKTLGSPETLRG